MTRKRASQRAAEDESLERDESRRTGFFFHLSPDRVLEAVEAVGLRPTGHCSPLNALENRVYDLRLEDETHVVAKFYRPGRWGRESIGDEHRMLAALREAEIPVCAPLASDDGETLHELEGIFYAIWPRTGGRSPDELSDEQVAVLGRLLARIHATGAALTIEHRVRLTSSEYMRPALDFLTERDFVPPACADRYRRAALEIASIYDDESEGVAFQPIHGDCHAGNLLHGEASGQGPWFFLDFDDMMIGPAVQDVWMLIPGRDAAAARQRALLVDAYRQFRPFEEKSLRLVEPLRAFRFVWYAGWIARRWEDPAFPDAFPHFGTAQYWENETRDLEEQLERIRGAVEGGVDAGGAPTPKTGDEPELTNEDFFWDL